MKLLTSSIYSSCFLLQFIELVDERLDHSLCAVCLVIFSCLTKSGLKRDRIEAAKRNFITHLDDVSVVIVEGDIMLEDVSSGLGWEYVVYNKLAVTGEEIPILKIARLTI